MVPGNAGLGLDANQLYYCAGSGAGAVLAEACGFTCVTTGTPRDRCSNSGSCAGVNNGYYCGTNLVVKPNPLATPFLLAILYFGLHTV